GFIRSVLDLERPRGAWWARFVRLPRGMRTSIIVIGASLVLGTVGCRNNAPPKANDEPGSKVEPAGGRGQATVPRVGPDAGDGKTPVETAPPNVPEFEPAFEGQTRAPAVATRTPLQATTVAEDLAQPWAIAFLPDGRMLVTEKHAGELYVVATDGRKSPRTSGVPEVDGGGQGGLLDVALDPDYATNGLVYLSYYEPRDDGNGLAVARGRLKLEAQPKLEDLQVVFRMKPTLDSD